jgi:hypothetical protein
MATGNLRFDGRGPYYLRAVEHATASALDETIQLTLYASVDDTEEKLVKIETQMTFDAAEDLAKALWKAAGETSNNPIS